jgi:hypothetical protein
MALHPNKKILFLALAVCIAFSVVSAETLAAANLGHHCTEEHCIPCLQIEMAKNFLKTLKVVSIVLCFAVLLVIPVLNPQKYTGFNPYLLSPVAQKVRSNS